MPAVSNTRRFTESCEQARRSAVTKDAAAVQRAIGESWRLLEVLRMELRKRGELGQIDELREELRRTVKICRDALAEVNDEKAGPSSDCGQQAKPEAASTEEATEKQAQALSDDGKDSGGPLGDVGGAPESVCVPGSARQSSRAPAASSERACEESAEGQQPHEGDGDVPDRST